MSYRPTLIEPVAAREYLAGGKGMAGDARTYAGDELADEEIPGAVHIDPNVGAARLLAGLPRATLLVCYCDEPAHGQPTGGAPGACARHDAVVLDGGLPAWKSAGLATDPRGAVALGGFLSSWDYLVTPSGSPSRAWPASLYGVGCVKILPSVLVKSSDSSAPS